MWYTIPQKINACWMSAIVILLTWNFAGPGLPRVHAQESSTATLISPVPGSELANSTITFRWTSGVGAQQYYLGVGTSSDSLTKEPWGDIYAKDRGRGVLAIVPNIPLSGKPVFVRLWSKIRGSWQFEDYSFQTKGQVVEPASMVSPSPGGLVTESSTMFTWTMGVGVQEFWLGVGTTLQQVSTKPYGDIFRGSQGLNTSVVVTGIPLIGQPIFVRLWSKLNGQWTSQDYTYSTRTQPQDPTLAKMISPVPETELISPDTTFSWNLGNGVQDVWLGVGTSFQSVSTKPWGDIFAGSVGLTTSVTVSDIPLNGADLFVRLWSKVGGAWKSRDYIYKTSNQGPSLIDFRTHPDGFETNINTFLVTGQADPASKVFLNTEPLSLDDQGSFVQPATLTVGDNVLNLSVENPLGSVEQVQKIITYNPQLNTSDRRIAYVDIVHGANGSVDGTLAVDLNRNLFLGLLPDKHVRGISPDGKELYMKDRSVVSTAFHQNLQKDLVFSTPIPWNGFLVSPDGMWLYSKNEKVNRLTNTVETLLPLSILTGSSFGGAAVPGTPAITSDGGQIFCCSSSNSVKILNTMTNHVSSMNMPTERVYQSDLAISPNGNLLAKTSYSGAGGNAVGFYDAHTLERRAIAQVGGDFIGQIGFSADSRRAFVGSSGNPRYKGGKVTVINLDTFEILNSLAIDLADNLVVSQANEIIVSSGNRLGLDVLRLGQSDELLRVKSFFIGVNRWAASTYTGPKNDEIRGIVLKNRR